MRVVTRHVCLAALASVLVTCVVGCGDARGIADNKEVSAQPGRWSAEVSAVSPGADGQSLIVRVDVLPVEGSTGACAVDIEHNGEPIGEVVYVDVAFRSNAPAPDPLFPLCDTAPRDLVIELAAPLAGRHVSPRRRSPAGVRPPPATTSGASCLYAIPTPAPHLRLRRATTRRLRTPCAAATCLATSDSPTNNANCRGQ